MRKALLASLLILAACAGLCLGQFGGGVVFSEQGARSRAEQAERQRRVLADNELPPTRTSTFVEASVLMNVKAEEYVATFGITQDGDTVADCSREMAARVKAFTDAIMALGIEDDDLFLDFVAQTKLYGFEMTGEVAREKLVGFELKKNLSVHFTDRARLEELVVVAARSEIHDLVKVDYVVKDADRVKEKLREEAARIIKRKIARYEQLLDIRLRPPAQIFAERYATHEPSELYDSYTAAESEQISLPPGWDRSAVQHARKTRTFFFNALDGDGFDHVINPVILEPVVQFTLYLKVKYDVEQPRAR